MMPHYNSSTCPVPRVTCDILTSSTEGGRKPVGMRNQNVSCPQLKYWGVQIDRQIRKQDEFLLRIDRRELVCLHSDFLTYVIYNLFLSVKNLHARNLEQSRFLTVSYTSLHFIGTSMKLKSSFSWILLLYDASLISHTPFFRRDLPTKSFCLFDGVKTIGESVKPEKRIGDLNRILRLRPQRELY